MYVYLYPQDAWFAVSLNVYLQSFVGGFWVGGSGGFLGGAKNIPPGCILYVLLDASATSQVCFSGWKC